MEKFENTEHDVIIMIFDEMQLQSKNSGDIAQIQQQSDNNPQLSHHRAPDHETVTQVISAEPFRF